MPTPTLDLDVQTTLLDGSDDNLTTDDLVRQQDLLVIGHVSSPSDNYANLLSALPNIEGQMRILNCDYSRLGGWLNDATYNDVPSSQLLRAPEWANAACTVELEESRYPLFSDMTFDNKTYDFGIAAVYGYALAVNDRYVVRAYQGNSDSRAAIVEMIHSDDVDYVKTLLMAIDVDALSSVDAQSMPAHRAPHAIRSLNDGGLLSAAFGYLEKTSSYNAAGGNATAVPSSGDEQDIIVAADRVHNPRGILLRIYDAMGRREPCRRPCRHTCCRRT